ncbi:siderophore ABC transporter substrate-binding protein [Elizabethkingia ursingii]|uniref:siderophore ABC transporter substrate-binding protein n=1 Tax=Elizabethkingia ursingii TaxID=1756150 RepID=UPI002011BD43|nr:siderophore ABC transporter substrate-binding protein [Elizabethkingia ursingii]MCL1670865.1 siderophore ABC transporter substrate-binding protein [Elizabethkingia ursingii]
MKKITLLLITLLVTLLIACNEKSKSNSSTEENVTIMHRLDTVSVPKNPQRVVVLDYGELEDLDLIGAKIVGIPKSGLPAHLKKYGDNPDIADVGNLMEVNIEKINELQPDLIIMGDRLIDSYPQVSKIAPTILVEWNTNDQLGALKKNLDNLGKIFNSKEVFNKEYNEIVARGRAIRSKASQLDKKALIVLHNKGRISAYGNGSRFGIIHDILGIKKAATNLDTHIHGTSISNEFVLEKNPDILFVIDRSDAIGDKGLNKSDFENELIKKTNAYKNGKIVYLNSSVWYLSGNGISSIKMMMNEVEKALD